MRPIINLTLTNIFHLVSFLSPILLVFYLMFSSLFSGFPMKGIMYSGGCIILIIFVILIRNIIKNEQSEQASIICNILPFPFGQSEGLVYTAPYINISLLFYSFFYILFSMLYSKYSFNILLIITLGIILICNVIVEFVNSCVDITSIVISILIGGLFGFFWYLFVSSINPAFTYFSEFVNNNVICSKPRPQSYVCSQKTGNKIEDKLSDDQIDQVINSITNNYEKKTIIIDLSTVLNNEPGLDADKKNSIDSQIKGKIRNKLISEFYLKSQDIEFDETNLTINNSPNQFTIEYSIKISLEDNDKIKAIAKRLRALTQADKGTYFNFDNIDQVQQSFEQTNFNVNTS